MEEAAAQASARPPAPAPAPRSAAAGASAGAGQSRLVAAVAGSLVLLVVLLIAGWNMSSKTARARSNLLVLMERAKGTVGVTSTPAFKRAEDKARTALKKSEGFTGGFTAAGDLEDASKEIERLIGSKNSSATVDDSSAARKAMLAAREAAEDADAKTAAQVEWSSAQSVEDASQKAHDQKGFDDAVAGFERAEMAYWRSALKAREQKARAEINQKKAALDTLIQSPDLQKAREYIPELIDGANAARAEAERSGDPDRALLQIRYAELLVRAAPRIALDIEKKN